MKKEFEVISQIIQNNKRVLDVGCGDGTLMKHLKDNKNIELNIDINLQKMIYQEFADRNYTGVAIVMQTDGSILAAVSYPSYDPNLFVGGISTKDWKKLQEDLAHPFTNKIVHGTYPPGSSIKMGMALAFSKANASVLESD